MEIKTETIKWLDKVLHKLEDTGEFVLYNHLQELVRDDIKISNDDHEKVYYTLLLNGENLKQIAIDVQHFLVSELDKFADLNISSTLFNDRHLVLISLTEEGRVLKRLGGYERYSSNKKLRQERNNLQRIDWVLHFMAKQAVQGVPLYIAYPNIRVSHPTFHVPGNESHWKQIVAKLQEDGYIENDKNRIGWYSITFEGLMFAEQGGYMGKSEESNIEKQRVKNNYRLTIILALGVIIPSLHDLVEICQHKTANINLQVLTIFYVFVSGVLATIVVVLLIKELTKMYKKSLS